MVINEYLFKNKDSLPFVSISILIKYDFLIILYSKENFIQIENSTLNDLLICYILENV